MKIVQKPRNSAKEQVIEILNQNLADAITLKLAAKHAHWNVRGENFLSLHELFDKLATSADEYADTIAERLVQLGGYAKGTLKDIEKYSSLKNYSGSEDYIKTISALVSELAEKTRHSIDVTADLSDAVTADILTEVTAGLDKLHWFVSSHKK